MSDNLLTDIRKALGIPDVTMDEVLAAACRVAVEDDIKGPPPHRVEPAGGLSASGGMAFDCGGDSRLWLTFDSLASKVLENRNTRKMFELFMLPGPIHELGSPEPREYHLTWRQAFMAQCLNEVAKKIADGPLGNAGAPTYRAAKALLKSVGMLPKNPTEHDCMAAFFATSEHKRHESETELDWAQLDRLLPDECAMPNAEANGFVSQSVQYRQVKGVVEARTEVRLDSGGKKYTRWTSLDVFANGPFHGPWHLERYHDALHAQKLIDEAIPGLPRVRKP